MFGIYSIDFAICHEVLFDFIDSFGEFFEPGLKDLDSVLRWIFLESCQLSMYEVGGLLESYFLSYFSHIKYVDLIEW